MGLFNSRTKCEEETKQKLAELERKVKNLEHNQELLEDKMRSLRGFVNRTKRPDEAEEQKSNENGANWPFLTR